MYFSSDEFISYINDNNKEDLNYVFNYINKDDFYNYIQKKCYIYGNDAILYIYHIANELFDKKYLNRKVKSYIIDTNDEDFIKLYNRLLFLNKLEKTTAKELFEFKVDNLDTFKNFLNKTKRRG